MLKRYVAEELYQNDNDASCVTRVTGITRTTIFTQDRFIDHIEEFRHTVEEARNVSRNEP